jgi:NAD(P)-dependent dehydrogenase (short-subunit alcohol dehydrogenase family)
VRTVVVGASSGLGRCIGVGLARRGAETVLMARRLERLEAAAAAAGPGTLALACDVTSAESCHEAMEKAVAHLGGIDALVYTPAIGPLGSLVDTDADTWRRVFDTNVIGAALVTTAALEHLKASEGVGVYLSSVSASLTPPWPGLGAYAVSKAALDKLVEAFRVEHPTVGFTRLTVGDCAGGEGDSMTGFANDWDMERAIEFGTVWAERKYLSDSLLDVEHLVSVVDALVRSGASLSVPSMTVTPRLTSASPPTPTLG